MRNIWLAFFLTVLLSSEAGGLEPVFVPKVGHHPKLHGAPLGRGASWVTAFVAADPEQAARLFDESGCRVHDRKDDIYIVSIPNESLPKLAVHSAVRRIEAGEICRLDMDTTSAVVNALPVYKGQSLPRAFTGKGVMVGVMDVGFDLTHPNFIDKDSGRRRIVAFWDQLSKDTIGSAFPVGRAYEEEAELDDAVCSFDAQIISHGTHTLGIAAGGGYDSPYRGMAYESDICIVANAVTEDLQLIDSADVFKYTTAVDALGFNYIFECASRAGKPCVASFSEGSYPRLDSEDSLYAAYLGKLTGPGRIIVASAGNESNRLGYLPKPLHKPSARTFCYADGDPSVFYIKSHGPLTVSLAVEGYAQAGDMQLRIADIPYGRSWADTLRLDGSDTWLHVVLEKHVSYAAPSDTISAVYVTVLRKGSPSAATLRLSLEGEEADAEAWRGVQTVFFRPDDREGWDDAEATHNVHVPAAFPDVIAVGSTIHRTGFTNYLGDYYDYSQAGSNDGVRSLYSSVGPALTGVTKPDVTAPGDNVISSYSSYYLEANPDARDISSDVAHFEYNGRVYAWNANTGTSMACPVVAGAIALWLEARPDLTPEEVVQTIRLTARHPDSLLDYPNNDYGHGEIDVYRGLLHLLGVDAIAGVDAFEPASARAWIAADGRLELWTNSPSGGRLELLLYQLSGECRWTGHAAYTAGNQRLTVDLPELPAGLYVVQLRSRESGMNGSQIVRIP